MSEQREKTFNAVAVHRKRTTMGQNRENREITIKPLLVTHEFSEP